MNIIRVVVVCAAMLLTFSTVASADVVTFDGSVTGDPYTEAGWVFNLTGSGHYGDASVGGAGTLNWHNGGANADAVVVTLTHTSGNAFTLNSFDLVGLGSLAANTTVLGTPYTTTGTKVVGSGPIFSAVFKVNPSGSISTALGGAIDNIDVSLAPEPASLVLLGRLIGVVRTRPLRRWPPRP